MIDVAMATTRPLPARPTAEDRDAEGGAEAVSVDLGRFRSAYLVGIGGVGMGGAAELLRGRGLVVRGSDRRRGRSAPRLEAMGVRIDVEGNGHPLDEDVDLVVASAAVPRGHPVLLDARARGLVILKYADLLGALMADRHAICVAGSHGKTTTSAMVASALLDAGRDPSFVVGGTLRGLATGARSGAGPHFVAESCEFDRSFHRHAPRVAVVLNVDEDHLDYYRDLREIQEAFRVFAARLPAEGLLVVNEAYAPVFHDDQRIRARTVTFGFGEGADWRLGEPRASRVGVRTRFSLEVRGRAWGEVEIPLLGRHMALDAAASVAVLDAVGLDGDEIRAGLAGFGGVGRRLEVVADRGGILLLDDYGHHPVEIRATIRALRQRYDGRRLLVIFQPHQASRTRCLMKEFAAALAEADHVLLPPIFFARDSEEERRRVTSEDLAAHIRNEGGCVTTLPDLGRAVEGALDAMAPGDVVITMGAGNVDEVAHGLAEHLR